MPIKSLPTSSFGPFKDRPTIIGPGGAGGDIILATKLGYFEETKSFRQKDALRRQLEDNLRLLRRDRVDVLQVHEGPLPPDIHESIQALGISREGNP